MLYMIIIFFSMIPEVCHLKRKKQQENLNCSKKRQVRGKNAENRSPYFPRKINLMKTLRKVSLHSNFHCPPNG